MIEVLSLVNFDNQQRIKYLNRSFGSFHKFNKVKRHIVIDGSSQIGNQKEIYEKLNIEYYHKTDPYSKRLKYGISLLQNDYFVFLPDDYEWIFDFPIEQAIAEAKKHNIKELKLVSPPMQWFSQANPNVEEWYDTNYVLKDVYVPTNEDNRIKRLFWDIHTFITKNEKLVKEDNLYISKRHFRRSFQQQFSLGCHILQTEFLKALSKDMPDDLLSPGEVEKHVYKQLFFKKYLTAYYKMQTPAFHFIDLDVEGREKEHIASTNLIKSNYKFVM